ncbi:MAG: branched-chain amino acid ABC transporter permease [Pararhodobacter sp.]|nr:branched-chain amino acid ABC transporter permease [Pararhodobacter sp.]
MQKSSVIACLEKAWPVLVLVLPLLVAVVLADLYGSVLLKRTVTDALIKIVIVVGLYIFIGNTGIVSFGHIGFAGIAAYFATWMTCCAMMKPITMTGLPDFLRLETYSLWSTALVSVAAAGLAALLIGLVLMRLSGLAASISTLAALFIFHAVYANWDNVTMGRASIVGIPTYVTLWVGLGGAFLAIIAAYLYQISSYGLAARAARDDEVAAQAAGISLYWNRLIAFVISGMVVGLGGVLQVHFMGTISVNAFYLNLTFLTLAMLVVGGMRSLAGAVVGVVVLSTIADVFRRLEAGVDLGATRLSTPTGTQEMFLAALMLLILIFRKDGLMGRRELRLPRLRAGRARAAQ